LKLVDTYRDPELDRTEELVDRRDCDCDNRNCELVEYRVRTGRMEIYETPEGETEVVPQTEREIRSTHCGMVVSI
jgi:hypothetical protein